MYRKNLADRHRLAWLEAEQQNEYKDGRFAAVIDRLLEFEEAWIDQIRPPDIHHPLILPSCAFETRPPLGDVWSRSRKVRLGGEPLSELRALIESFKRLKSESLANNPRRWRDDVSRLFKFPHPNEYHAHVLPNAQRWKFTLKFSNGFHFDVSDARGRPFSVTDHSGAAHSFNRYTNVDPMGTVRGGD